MSLPTTVGTGHAFISYVREDAAHVDRIQSVLEAAGVAVWRDTANLWPGEDWKLKIRQAITSDSLAFIACFSENSAAREKSYQNEELLLAVDQFRLRPPDKPWLIPVRLSDCQIPQYDLGAGRTLDSLQRLDLFDDRWERGVPKLVAGVLRILGEADIGAGGTIEILEGLSDEDREAALPDAIKGMLLDPQRQIALDDLVTSEANSARHLLLDEGRFPTGFDQMNETIPAVRYIVSQCDRYWDAVRPLAVTLATGCAWGRDEHVGIWARAMRSIAGTATRDSSGLQALIDLRRYPVLPVLYAGGLASVDRGNYASLRAITIDAQVRHRGKVIPAIGIANVWGAFGTYPLPAHVLAFVSGGAEVTDEMITELATGRKGKRYTPVSDHLHQRLRDLFRATIPDDEDYGEDFDRLEVLLAAILIDVRGETNDPQIRIDLPWYGSYTWRYRYSDDPLEKQIQAELLSQKEHWPPLKAGLFGGSRTRASQAFEILVQEAAETRQRHW